MITTTATTTTPTPRTPTVKVPTWAACLEFLLSDVYGDNPVAPEHLTDLRASGLTDGTIQRQRLRSVPPHMIAQLLGFKPPIHSALLVPFPDPRASFMHHVRMKVFPPYRDRQGNTVKYLQRRGSGVHLFFTIGTLQAALNGAAPLWLVEGEKKALAVAQLGLPAVGFCGIEGWHQGGSMRLIPDFDVLPLQRRVIELLPDGDWRTNPSVERGVCRLAEALEARGARVGLRVLPSGGSI